MRGLAERRGAEQFAALLERPGDVPTVESELADLLLEVRALRGLPATRDLDATTRDRMRRRLVAVAAVRPAAAEEAAAVQSAVPVRRRWWQHRAVLAGSAVAVVLASTGVGVGAASTGAMPGNPLYGIKRGTESARLATAESGTARGQLLLGFAGTRLTEADRAGDGARAVTALRAMDAQTVAGVRLLDTAAVDGRDVHPLDVVEDFLTRQRPHLVTMLADEPAPQARAAAATALALLDRVQGRVEALKDSLPCAAPGGTISTDDLGPLPIPCGTPAPGGAAAPTAGPAPTAPSASEPATATASPSLPASPSASPAPTGSAAPTSSPTPTPTASTTPTATPTASPTPSPSSTPTASPTPSPPSTPTAPPSASGESPTVPATGPTVGSEPPGPVSSIIGALPDPTLGDATGSSADSTPASPSP